MSAKYQRGSLEPYIVSGHTFGKLIVEFLPKKHKCFRIKYEEINVQVKEVAYIGVFLLW